MSIFDINNVPKDEKKAFKEIPEGKYFSKVIKSDIKKTKSGHNCLNLHIKTDAGLVFNMLNFDHPSCKAITQKTVAKILESYENPPTQVGTLQELSELITGLPVEVFVKHKGFSDNGTRQYGIYFNDLDKAKRVKLAEGGVKKARVEY